MTTKIPDNIGQILDNPSDYGVPTFEEFVKNHDKYTGKCLNTKLGYVDQGSQNFKTQVKVYIYYVNGIKANSLEHLEVIARNEGINLLNCDMEPQMIETSAGEYKIIVNFKSRGIIF